MIGQIELLSEKISSKEVNVAVIGLGYVGLPLALLFADNGISVKGVDIDSSKIESLVKGCSYISSCSSEKVEKSLLDGYIQFHSDFECLHDVDAIIIAVPTPLDKNQQPDLGYVKSTCESIAPYLTDSTLVILESTTWPGTTNSVVKEILSINSKIKSNDGIFLAYSPEREDPGRIDYNTKSIPKLVGGVNEHSSELAVQLYSVVIKEVIKVGSTEIAETAKLFENIFRSVNIALVNELKMVLDPMGINVWEVIKAASTKPFGFMPFWPGPGLGGHCIPIDPFYLSWKAKEYGINTRFIELAGEINRSMPTWVVRKIQDCLNEFGKALKGSKILILGMAYKPDVDDMRESPSLALMELLEKRGAMVDYFDPWISEIPLTRDHAKYIGKKSIEPNVGYSCFVLATAHKCFDPIELLSFEVPILDTRNFFGDNELVWRA